MRTELLKFIDLANECLDVARKQVARKAGEPAAFFAPSRDARNLPVTRANNIVRAVLDLAKTADDDAQAIFESAARDRWPRFEGINKTTSAAFLLPVSSGIEAAIQFCEAVHAQMPLHWRVPAEEFERRFALQEPLRDAVFEALRYIDGSLSERAVLAFARVGISAFTFFCYFPFAAYICRNANRLVRPALLALATARNNLDLLQISRDYSGLPRSVRLMFAGPHEQPAERDEHRAMVHSLSCATQSAERCVQQNPSRDEVMYLCRDLWFESRALILEGTSDARQKALRLLERVEDLGHGNNLACKYVRFLDEYFHGDRHTAIDLLSGLRHQRLSSPDPFVHEQASTLGASLFAITRSPEYSPDANSVIGSRVRAVRDRFFFNPDIVAQALGSIRE